MASFHAEHKQASFAANSYDTALCVIPPQPWCEEVDKLRSLYDKAFDKWPPHINLVYPFVSPENLPGAKKSIEEHLQASLDGSSPHTLVLGGAGLFKLRKDNTIFLGAKGLNEENVLDSIRSVILQALGLKVKPSVFHLTVGQAQDHSVSASQFLLDKVNRVPEYRFEIGSLAILVREKSAGKATDASSQMRLWGSIALPVPSQTSPSRLIEFWHSTSDSIDKTSADHESPDIIYAPKDRQIQPGTTHQFNQQDQTWVPSICPLEPTVHFSISTYNVLADSEHPPANDRDTLLVNTILEKSALSDILVLQEISDEFLSHLLGDKNVREAFPFASHGPPSQADIGPLPSLRNIVMLSRWHFDWEFVPFQRRHKRAIIVTFPSLFPSRDPTATLLVVAGVHLTAGLTDGSVVAKKRQLQSLTSYLDQKYASTPWIVAGDFNLPTSRYTIDEAVKEKSISLETSHILDSTESNMSELGLLDAWAVARVEGVDETAALDSHDLLEGEEGATFDPHTNHLAGDTSGTPENRPQRYDRIFVRPLDRFTLTNFNQFGRPEFSNNAASIASDHYGIRGCFQILPEAAHQRSDGWDILQKRMVQQKHTPLGLSSTAGLTSALSRCAVFPSHEDEERYKQAFDLINAVLLGHTVESQNTSEMPMVIVPVGSYALNVWTPESDIDCLCIGPISSRTFFQLARQRIVKADAKGLRLLRKVEANTGTMLELSVNGVNMDLQYCPAADIVNRYLSPGVAPYTFN